MTTDAADAARYRWLLAHGNAHSKKTGIVIGSPLVAQIAFRYWVDPVVVSSLIRRAPSRARSRQRCTPIG